MLSEALMPHVVAEFDYDAPDDTQLSFQAGDKLVLVEESDSGWWIAKHLNSDIEGFIPATYVKKEAKRPKRPPPPNPRANLIGGSGGPPPVPQAIIPATNPGTWSTPTTRSTRKSEWANAASENYYAENVLNLNFNPNARTRFGLQAHYMGLASGGCCLLMGIVGIDWALNNPLDSFSPTQWRAFADFQFSLISGCYGLALSIPLFAWEWRYGSLRQVGAIPFRAFFFFLASAPLFLSYATAIAGTFLLLTAAFNLAAWINKEEYTQQKRSEYGDVEQLTFWERISCFRLCRNLCDYVSTVRQQSRVNKYVFLFLYIAANLYYLGYTGWFYFDQVAKMNGDCNCTKATWLLPVAKMMGALLNINSTMILLPVSRSFVRFLYDLSTDQSNFGICCNYLLYLFPLDKALQFHKLCAGICLVAATIHAWGHYMHLRQVPDLYAQKFNPEVWITGIGLVLVMLFMYSTSLASVRRGKFELFWYTHHLFVFYEFFCLIHGSKWVGPNFWKFFIIPGALYIGERVFREHRARQPVGVVSVTHMNNDAAKVFCLELEKTGPIAKYREGQYIFIRAPICSRWQWHPFTISSAPDDKTLTLHIRNQGPGTWTDRVQSLFEAMGPRKKYIELFHRDGTNLVPQAVGPDGRNLICVDGPMAAPTQHLGEYHNVMIVGAGIGVTPLRAAMHSIVYFRFRRGMGHTFPDNAYFVWIVNWKQLDAYRFMVRTIKEIEDELKDLEIKNNANMAQKTFQFHIFVTSSPKQIPEFDVMDVYAETEDEEKGIWGPKYAEIATHSEVASSAMHAHAEFKERDIFKTLKMPSKHPTQIGHCVIHSGRPKWDELFLPISRQHEGERIGVMFCGPDIIASQLKVKCGEYTDFDSRTYFILHKENF